MVSKFCDNVENFVKENYLKFSEKPYYLILTEAKSKKNAMSVKTAMRKIRLKTLRSHVQVGWKPSQKICSSTIKPIIKKMSQMELWDKRLPDMVMSYFSDMEETLKLTAKLVKMKGQAWIVVSTSAYGGIEIPVSI